MSEKETTLIATREIQDKIVIVRKKEVITDADVAALYGVQTKEVNQAVRNNRDKFPPQTICLN